MIAQVPHPEEIKAAIRIKYGSMGAFERALNLPEKSVSDVLRGRSARHTEDAIAEVMMRPVTELFPRRKSEGVAAEPDNMSEMSDAHRINSGAN